MGFDCTFIVPNQKYLFMKLTKYVSALALASMLAFTSCTTDSFDQDEDLSVVKLVEAPSPKTIELEILDLINDYRLNLGLTPLKHHTTVKSIAFTHTDYMVEVNNVSHDNFYQRKNSLQVYESAVNVSENVGYGYSSAQAVVNAWINSDDHRANIEGDFTDFDISAEQNADGRWYFTNIFMKR